MSDERLERTLSVAEDVVAILAEHQVPALVIGGMALAVHGYPRDTVDLELAIAIQPRALNRLAQELRDRGYQVELREADREEQARLEAAATARSNGSQQRSVQRS